MISVIELPENFEKDKEAWLGVSQKILAHYKQDRSLVGVGRCIDIWRVRKDLVEAEVIDGLGFLLGELIIEKHGGEWVFVNYDSAKIPAICKSKDGMLTFVIDAVSKRLRDTSCQAVGEIPNIARTYETEGLF